jgi:Fur family ferric uptake transcriptional regulator
MRPEAILTRFSIQPTEKRLAILDIFIQNSHPLDSQFILDEVKKTNPGIDRATIFRTLNTFTNSGLLLKLEFNEGKSRYELALKEHHHHVVCTECGKFVCIEHCNLKSIDEEVTKETGFKINFHRLEFFGICPDCQKKIS